MGDNTLVAKTLEEFMESPLVQEARQAVKKFLDSDHNGVAMIDGFCHLLVIEGPTRENVGALLSTSMMFGFLVALGHGEELALAMNCDDDDWRQSVHDQIGELADTLDPLYGLLMSEEREAC